MTLSGGKSLQSRGFTLIELLVVIAIIGLLSSVVLASLSTARGKAKDAAIKTLANEMRKVYEIEYSTNGSYAGLKPTDPIIGSNYSKSSDALGDSYIINNSTGCSNFYNTNSEGEKICKDLFVKGVASGGYTIATKDTFITTYVVHVQYPSSSGSGRCISNSGYIADEIASNCRSNGLQ